MLTSKSNHTGLKVFSFYPTYENVHALLTEIHVHVFDREGGLLDSQAVRRGKAQIVGAEDGLCGARVVIAPPLENLNGPVTLESARGHYIFESKLDFELDKFDYLLPPVPEAIWRWWLVHSLWKNICGNSL